MRWLVDSVCLACVYVLTDLLSSAGLPLLPLHHGRGLDGINGYHRGQMHPSWFTGKQTNKHTSQSLSLLTTYYLEGIKHQLTITSTDLYRESSKKAVQAALHFIQVTLARRPRSYVINLTLYPPLVDQ